MLFIYNIGIYCYVVLIHAYSLYNSKGKLWLKGRKESQSHKFPAKKRKRILFHCASVGEFEQALPIIEKVTSEYEIVVSFFSVSGFQYATKKHPDLTITYLPFDFKSNMVHFISKVDPDLVVIVKYEFWHHFIDQLADKKIPIMLVCGIFRSNQYFFKNYGVFFRKILEKFKYLLLQNEESKRLLDEIDIKNSHVLGDTRFDRVTSLKNTAFSDATIEAFIEKKPVFIGGSVWDSDEKALLQIITKLPKDYKIILAPHEIKHYDVKFLNEEVCFYSSPQNINARIMILDTMGILSKIYRYADLTYVGGGYGAGLHNILEPAVYGNPVFIGKNFSKFHEAVSLHNLGLAVDSSKMNDTSSFIEKWLNSEEFKQKLRQKIEYFFTQNSNVADKIAVLVSRALNEKK